MGVIAIALVPHVAVVVIGRNEGDRLRRCLESVVSQAGRVVYVDSGSSDGSMSLARDMGLEAIELDMSRPFTAARARNTGWKRLLELDPDVEFVQFLDGDCEAVKGWVGTASAFLQARPEVGVVCGRLRERFPEHSLYNLLCDIEWDTPPGETLSCGGN